MQYPALTLSLPDWIKKIIHEDNCVFKTLEERMHLAIKLAKLNIEHRTGGPFGACVFEQQSGKLIAPGVNLVPPSSGRGRDAGAEVAQDSLRQNHHTHRQRYHYYQRIESLYLSFWHDAHIKSCSYRFSEGKDGSRQGLGGCSAD